MAMITHKVLYVLTGLLEKLFLLSYFAFLLKLRIYLSMKTRVKKRLAVIISTNTVFTHHTLYILVTSCVRTSSFTR